MKRFLFIFPLVLLPSVAVWAQQSGLPALTSTPGLNGSTTWSLSLQTLVMLTAITFLPAVLLMMTSFTRIVIVLSLLRSALGLQSSPPNQVIVGLSLFMTFFVMSPVIDEIYTQAYEPLDRQEITFQEALNRAQPPLRNFMLKQTRENDVALFVRMAKMETPPESMDDIPMRILIPSFIISELKTAFQIGFMVFLPFLVIDLVVSSVLMSMGMMMLSPVLISLPFKLMLFVMADGWNLLVGSLISSFVT